MKRIVKTLFAASPPAGAVVLCVLLVAVPGSGPLVAQEQEAQEQEAREASGAKEANEDEPREYVYRFDPEASEVSFVLDAFMHKVHGSFDLVGGEIRFEPATGEASGEVVVDATSGVTGNEKRDRDMHRKVLESKQYPRIVLEVLTFRGDLSLDAPSEIELDARLRIHGDEHPLSLRLRLEPEGGRLRAETGFVVPYVDWGMEDPSTFFLRVGKEVTVTIDAVGTVIAVDPPPASDPNLRSTSD